MAEIASARLLGTGHITPRRGWSARRHVHSDHHELIVVHAGALRVTTRGRTRVARCGQALLYLRGHAHDERAERGLFASHFLSWRGEPDDADWPVLMTDDEGRLGTLVRWLWELDTAGEAAGSPLCTGLLRGVLRELERLRGGTEPAFVRDVRAHILSRLDEALSLDDLAGVAGLSRYHFGRRFKAATGATPMAYLRRLRVDAARGLLLTTPLPLRAIAAQVGFADEFQLSRVCKRVLGRPPSSFRH